MNNSLTIIYTILLLIIFNSSLFAQNEHLEYAIAIEGLGNKNIEAISDDIYGNIYITGTENSNVFVSKMNANGRVLWKKSIAASGFDTGISVEIDRFGNVIVAGRTQDGGDFDPGPGVFLISSYGGFFTIKLDSDGNFIWGMSLPPSHLEGMTIDQDGNVFLAGWYTQTYDFDPGPGTFNMSSPNNRQEGFLVKLDSDGNFLWAAQLGSTSSDFIYDIHTDPFGDIYLTGTFTGTVDFDFTSAWYVVSSNNAVFSCCDVFIQKINSNGGAIWVKPIGRSYEIDMGENISTDPYGNVYITGRFRDSVDFNPDPVAEHMLYSNGDHDIFAMKLDSSGNFIWANSRGSGREDFAEGIIGDADGNCYLTGTWYDTVDFDPGPGVVSKISAGGKDAFVSKLDTNGNLLWVHTIGSTSNEDEGKALHADNWGNIYFTGNFRNTIDAAPGPDTFNLSSPSSDNIYLTKLTQKKIIGHVYLDINQDCTRDANELGFIGRRLIIQPGNIVVETNSGGRWALDELPAGNYTITADSSGTWIPTCAISQSFTVVHPDSFLLTPAIGFVSTTPCPKPDVTVTAPFIRYGFSNQRIYIEAENDITATGSITNPYVIVNIDTLMRVDTSSMLYTDLGNNQYRFDINTLDPGDKANFWIATTVSPNSQWGESLCMSAELYPIAVCTLDSIPNPSPPGITPCLTAYDDSHLEISAECINDSIFFYLSNSGTGDMSCFSQYRIFIDGQLTFLDSVQLMSGTNDTLIFTGDGKTWRLETDQHPLHPGNSQPSITIELCGNLSNWRPNLVNLFPHDDADPHVDIYCGIVTGSYAPNDKTGFPLGLSTNHEILPNGEIEYLIRFQNTGTDTAFTVVIRDTLSADLDILSVQSGAASHNYSFRLYGPRVLEWTFEYIMLPDSNVNEAASHGFTTFKVKQKANLPIGTVIENSASIYFDFNPPIFTNTTNHTIAIPQNSNWDGQETLSFLECDSVIFRGYSYTESGEYFQVVSNGGLDSLYQLDVTILKSSVTNLVESHCNSYTAPDAQVYTTSGQYAAYLTNAIGCDSIILINLSINSTTNTLNENSCNNYTAPDAQVYTTSGQYSATIPNAVGCDSIITINLTITDSTSSVINEEACFNYTAPDAQIYTTSGQYSAIIPNIAGCDSSITINLTIYDSTSSSINETSCFTYTAPDAQVYTNSGQYTAIIPNVGGCDSTITIDLTITDSSSSVISETSCFSYMAPNFFVYTLSGQYTATIPNTEGCDSIITINLTIDSIPINSIAQNGFTLTADATGLTYQWLDCANGNSPILGATNQIFNPTGNGNYAVEITNGTCTTTSNCINITGVGMTGLENDFGINIYPNPTDSKVYLDKTVEGEIHFKLIDNLGRELISKSTDSPRTVLDLSKYPAAVYYLSIRTADKVRTVKLVRE